MAQKVLIIQGHPDPAGGHFGHALAAAYASGARAAGREVHVIDVAHLDFPLIRTREAWREGAPPPAIEQAQRALAWCEHIVLVYPLWLGTMPALVKAFLEQVLRESFAFHAHDGQWRPALKGRSARVVITMGMPAFVYRWFFGAHSLKSLERNILRFCGVRPVRASLVGGVETGADRRARWLARMESLGRAAR